MTLVGSRFSRLVVLRVSGGRDQGGRLKCVCLCDCGRQTTLVAYNLKNGHTTSCGCAKSASPPNFKHGLRLTREYDAWKNARLRCNSPKNAKWADYGGRGITMCAAWQASFETFLTDMGPCPDGLTLDRRDNDGHYEPGNCRWATPLEQTHNQRPKRKRRTNVSEQR